MAENAICPKATVSLPTHTTIIAMNIWKRFLRPTTIMIGAISLCSTYAMLRIPCSLRNRGLSVESIRSLLCVGLLSRQSAGSKVTINRDEEARGDRNSGNALPTLEICTHP